MAWHRYGKDRVPAERRVFVSKLRNEQEAHEAIRPTDIYRLPCKLLLFQKSDVGFPIFEEGRFIVNDSTDLLKCSHVSGPSSTGTYWILRIGVSCRCSLCSQYFGGRRFATLYPYMGSHYGVPDEACSL